MSNCAAYFGHAEEFVRESDQPIEKTSVYRAQRGKFSWGVIQLFEDENLARLLGVPAFVRFKQGRPAESDKKESPRQSRTIPKGTRDQSCFSELIRFPYQDLSLKIGWHWRTRSFRRLNLPLSFRFAKLSR